MINKRTVFPAIALCIAALSGCGGGNPSSIKGIPSQDSDVAATNLFHAAELGDLSALQKFVSQGQVLTNRHTENQKTALHYAAWGGHTNIIAWLLEQKADINALDTEGQAPLDFAWMPRSESAKTLLLASGAKTGKELRPSESKPTPQTEVPKEERDEDKPIPPQ